MRQTKLVIWEQKVLSALILIVGIGHGITYVLKTDKCNACGNFVDSDVVIWFHISNYTMWFLLFYAAIVSTSLKGIKFVFFIGMGISEYLLFNEIFGNPKDWGLPVVIGFFLVVALSLVKYNPLLYKKKLYI